MFGLLKEVFSSKIYRFKKMSNIQSLLTMLTMRKNGWYSNIISFCVCIINAYNSLDNVVCLSAIWVSTFIFQWNKNIELLLSLHPSAKKNHCVQKKPVDCACCPFKEQYVIRFIGKGYETCLSFFITFFFHCLYLIQDAVISRITSDTMY